MKRPRGVAAIAVYYIGRCYDCGSKCSPGVSQGESLFLGLLDHATPDNPFHWTVGNEELGTYRATSDDVL